MNALEIRQLKKTYGNHRIEALKGIDLTVEEGDFFALLGANGAGKSTTIGLITTLLTKTSGSISVCGYSLDTHPSEAKACLGLVPQEINLNIFETCEQILINQAGFYGIPRRLAQERAASLLQQLGLIEKRTHIARHLSGGMKRRLMIARALMHEPKVLILDEPTAGVDIEIRRSMWEFLTKTNAQGTTIILTTHYLEEAEQLCKNVAIIDRGAIVQNTSMKNVLRNVKHQTFVFTTKDPLFELSHPPTLQTVQLDANTFELRLDRETSLNEAFRILTEQGLIICSMRNKTNRLEELFLELIQHGH